MNNMILFTYDRWCFFIIVRVKGRHRVDDNEGSCGGLTAESPVSLHKKWKIGMKDISLLQIIYINHKEKQAETRIYVCVVL